MLTWTAIYPRAALQTGAHFTERSNMFAGRRTALQTGAHAVSLISLYNFRQPPDMDNNPCLAIHPSGQYIGTVLLFLSPCFEQRGRNKRIVPVCVFRQAFVVCLFRLLYNSL